MKYALSRALAPADCSAVTPSLGGPDDACGTDDRSGRGCTEARASLPELPPAAVDRSAPRREAGGAVVRPLARRRAGREAAAPAGAGMPPRVPPATRPAGPLRPPRARSRARAPREPAENQ